MKPVRSFSLRLWLPLLVIFLAFLVWALMTWHEFDHLETNLIDFGKQSVTQDMASLQHVIENDLSLGQKTEAERALASRGVNTQYRFLVVIDDQGRIMYSTRFAMKGLQAANALPDFDPQQFADLQQYNRAELFVEPDKKSIIAYFPLTLERDINEIRPLRTGALFVVYDYSAALALSLQELWHKSELIALILFIGLFVLFILIHYYFYRPIQHLASTAQAFAGGDIHARSNISGSGELASLAKAFNDMGVQLIERSRQREQAEKDLHDSVKLHRNLIEATAAVAWEYDLVSKKFTYMSPQIFQLTGFPVEQWTDYAFWEAQIHPEDREFASDFCQTETTVGRNHSFEYRFITADGKPVWIRDEVSVVVERGKPVVLRGYFFDITELKQTERALRRSQKMDAIGQLTGGIAHDFNNILSIVLGNLDLMHNQVNADEKLQKRFDVIDHSLQRAINLTRQLLSFSRHEAASAKVANINQIIESMHELVSQSLTPEVEVEHHMNNDLWLTLIDAGDFEDALVNLSLNARDAMHGQGKLTIETRNCVLDKAYCKLNPAAVPGDYVQLVVSDNGDGIPADQQERIFEPFYTSKEQGKGTGLGLSMVFGFVKRSGGTIKVYSELGIGTTFRIYLPRAGSDELDVKESNGEEKVMPRGRETILAVDDEVALLDLVFETLTKLGYCVLTANNASQAEEIFAADPDIDLLFSDVVMPGELNGFQLAEKLVAERPELKVLLTSGYTDKAVARNGQARFKTNMLTKPYTLVDLAQRIRQTLGLPADK